MTAPAADDVQPGPIQPPQQERRGMLGRRLAFREPSQEELDQILSSGSSETEEGSPEEAPAYDSAGPQSPESGRSESAGTSSQESATRAGKQAPPLFASEKARLTARRGVLLASVRAHHMLVRTQEQARLGMYIADEEDQENIGDPLANIAARRSGGALSDNPDVNDGVQALLGLANYMVKQFQISMVAKTQVTGDQQGPATIDGEVAA